MAACSSPISDAPTPECSGLHQRCVQLTIGMSPKATTFASRTGRSDPSSTPSCTTAARRLVAPVDRAQLRRPPLPLLRHAAEVLLQGDVEEGGVVAVRAHELQDEGPQPVGCRRRGRRDPLRLGRVHRDELADALVELSSLLAT